MYQLPKKRVYCRVWYQANKPSYIMKSVVIAMLSYNLILSFGNAQYPWSNTTFHESMCGKASCEDLVVETVQGKVQGRAFEAVLDKTEYYAFLGIPFAKPPLGELRFQVPQPADPWSGVYPAYYEKAMCEQIVPFGTILGLTSEDCLYLSVYTPEVPRKIDFPKPVMVSIHGGGFVAFAGIRLFFSPDHWVTRDVVVVLMNYRLGAFGFLNLGIPQCSGNMGLKDQVLALKWVQQNIARFGGDPNNVTIVGESAGGTSVHFHLLSPMSKGLFHKAVIQSGTALSPWALIYNPFDQAFQIGKRTGFRGTGPRKLLKHLKSKSTMSISFASALWILHNRHVYPARYITMAPTVEVPSEEAFLPDFPSNLMKSANTVPTIFGFNNKEGIFIALGVDNQCLNRVSRNFSLLLSDNFPIKPELVSEVSMKIKQNYFGDKPVGMETANLLVDVYSDITNYYAYDSMEFLINSPTPPYVYYFAYGGNLNYGKKVFNFLVGTKLKGAIHGDDQIYIYYPSILSAIMDFDDETKNVINFMATALTNFAKTGNPSGVVNWKASTSNEAGYLLIDRQPRMMPGKFHSRQFEFFRSTLDPAIKPGSRVYDIF